MKPLKPFITWDGEGVSDSAPPGETRRQRFVLWGSSTHYLTGHDLTTRECLDTLLACKSAYPYSVFVGYALDYDVNMILRDVPERIIRDLWEQGHVTWGGYRLKYQPHKMFGVSTKGHKAVILFDVYTFFGTSFVRALEDYDVCPPDDLEQIKQGKKGRATFTDAEVNTVVLPYWRLEHIYLKALCDRLRESLSRAGLHLSKWHGPGAVASALLTRHGIKSHIKGGKSTRDMADMAAVASRNAYAGGRFEPFRIGRYVGEIYQYDIRSAYPNVLRLLPPLKGARWEETSYDPGNVEPWSLYHCAFSDMGEGPFGVSHWRFPNGNMAYPRHNQGVWNYGITVLAMLRHGGRVAIDRVLRLDYDRSMVRPFHFIEDLYKARAIWKMQGNQAQWAAKLGMNSVYGKLAQRVGESDGPPPFHCLEWAGMITAYCRAQIANVLYLNPSAVIATETDSVFSTAPLPLPLGDELGGWELTKHKEIIYLQSGVYFLDGHAGKAKTRGVSAGLLDYHNICGWLNGPSPVDLVIPYRRFHGMGTGLTQGNWCHWVDTDKTLNPLSLEGKRYHNPASCRSCQDGLSFYQGLHDMTINPLAGYGHSTSHKLPWISDE